jgi:hypothetical protein
MVVMGAASGAVGRRQDRLLDWAERACPAPPPNPQLHAHGNARAGAGLRTAMTANASMLGRSRSGRTPCRGRGGGRRGRGELAVLADPLGGRPDVPIWELDGRAYAPIVGVMPEGLRPVTVEMLYGAHRLYRLPAGPPPGTARPLRGVIGRLVITDESAGRYGPRHASAREHPRRTPTGTRRSSPCTSTCSAQGVAR